MRILSFQVLLWSLLSLPGWSEELSPAVRDQISRAERELRLAEVSHRRAQSQLDELQDDPAVSDKELLTMESYVFELSELVRVRKETLTDLQAMAGQSVPAPDPTVTEGMEAFEQAVGEVPSTEEESEQERLDREFAASLEAFDGMIRDYTRELEDQIAARSAKGEAAASPHQTAASEAEALLRSMGVDPGTGGEQEPPGQQETAATETGGEPASGPATETAGTSPGREGPGTPGQGTSRPPREDEDVVARQLREAAEKETDPVLREKLWKEYEAYIDGRS
jgi:hypothetical protein